MEKYEEVVIVGGGIAGLATALGLKRVGVRALVLERSHELRATGAAIGLFSNAWRALDALGVAHDLANLYTPLTEVKVTEVGSGQVVPITFTTETFDREGGLGARPVHRRALLEALARELPPETIRFSSKLASITTKAHQDSSLAVLRLEDGTIINTKVLIGCDGVHSVVAQWLGLTAPVHSGRMAIRGLAVYPEGHGLKKEVQQFVYEGLRAGFAPLNSTDVYWFMTHRSCGGDATKDPELIQKYVLEIMAKNFPTAYLEVVQHTDLTTLTSTPLMFRFPWDLIFGTLTKGNVTVAGDAMHPMTPDLGQGGCAALEDAVVLSRHIGNSLKKEGGIFRSEAIKEALEGYVNERRWRAAGLITGAYLSGWVQQGGSSWLAKFIRYKIFYGLLYKLNFSAIRYDCGKLPIVSSEVREN